MLRWRVVSGGAYMYHRLLSLRRGLGEAGGARYRLSLMIGGLWRAVACGMDAALRVDGPACGMHFGAWNDLLFDES